MFWLPSVLNEVVQVACPLLTGTVLPPLHVKLLAVSLNVIMPSFTVLLEVTVAVNVTELPGAVVKEGSLFEDTEVVVGVATTMVAKFPITVAGAAGMWKLVLAEVVESNVPPVEVQLLKAKPALAVAVTGMIAPKAKYWPEVGVTEPSADGEASMVN